MKLHATTNTSSAHPGDGHLRSLVKAASWRATGTVDTFILGFLFTGSVKLAGSIASTEVITKLGLFYFHERAWNRLSWGRAKPTRVLKMSPAVARAAT
jgi:uncharacterized membrane protein